MIDWEKLKDYSNSKHLSFEMFSYVIASRLYASKGKFTFIDGGGGDGGVEFYLTLPNNNEWGWQAKFFHPDHRLSSAGRKNQIIKSLKSACKNHPNLKRYFLCTPTNFTPKEKEWFETKLYDEIPIEINELELIHWGDSEFNKYLSSPNFKGILNYFFGELELDLDWFKHQYKKNNADNSFKFEKELYTEREADNKIKNVLLFPKFLSKINNKEYELQKKLEKIIYFDKQVPSQNINEKSKEKLEFLSDSFQTNSKNGLNQMKKVISLLRNKSCENLEKFDLKNLTKSLKESHEKFKKITNQLLIKLEKNEKKTYYKFLIEYINLMNTFCIEISSLILDLEKVIFYDLHVFGNANTGKTNMVSNICYVMFESKKPALMISGKKFSTNFPINTQLKYILDIPSEYSFNDFLDILNVVAKVYGIRIPFIIDGLNEATNGLAISNIWKNYLKGFIEDIKKRKNILLITTCRKTYKKEIWGDNSPKNSIYVHEFIEDDIKIEAINKYFEHYKIKANLTDAPFYQFKNPLYLKFFCESINAEKKKEKEVYINEETLQEIFDKYIDNINEKISNLLDIDSRANLVQKSLKKIGKYSWSNKSRYIPIDVAESIDGSLFKKSESMILALQNEGLLIYKEIMGGNEAFLFTYDLFGGYIIAKFLIEEYNSNIEEFIKSDESINNLFSEEHDKLHPFFEDIRRTLSILLITKKHEYLHEILLNNEQAVKTSIQALFEIPPENINEDSEKYLEDYFLYKKSSDFDLFVNTVTSVSHPLNAKFLFNLLKKMEMNQRDLQWTEYLRNKSRYFENYVDEFENYIKLNSISENLVKKFNLFAYYVMLFLTSTNKILRDKSTEILYYYGRLFPEDFFDLVEESLDINDPWISERMLAAAYGVAMALHYNIEDNSFSKNILPKWGRKIYDLMFKKGAKYSTTHLLKRDYAKGIVDITLIHNPKLLSKDEQKRIEPPFNDGGIREWGENDDKDKGKYNNGNYPLDGIVHEDPVSKVNPMINKYAKFTIDSKSSDRLAYEEIEKKLLWRIYQLGYSLDLFGEIDKNIEAQKYHDPNIKTYGHGKYVDIAVLELAGYNDDLGLFRTDYINENHSPLVDIDPSFPTNIQSHEIIRIDVDNIEVSSEEWIANTDVKIDKCFLLDEVDGKKGPWVLLDGFFDCEYDENGRDIYLFTRGFFVKGKDYNDLFNLLNKQDLRNRWLPEISDNYYIFAGELPWSDMFSDEEWRELNFDNKHRKIGEKHEISVLCPVTSNIWEGHHSPIMHSMNANIPIKQVLKDLDLFSQPQTFDFYDIHGKASITIEYGEHFKNHQHFTYIRQDLFDKFLSMNNYKFILVLWGNKEIIDRTKFPHIIKESHIRKVIKYNSSNRKFES